MSDTADKTLVKTTHERLLDGLKRLVQVSAENIDTPLGSELLRVAQKHDVVLMTFIAPESGIKVSPSINIAAQIGLFEEFGLQCALAQIRDEYPEMVERPLWLLVHSPGGGVPSSYMIAKRLQESFEKVVAFVPHVAYSGGTLIALSANEIVMGEFSRLGPLDPQVAYARSADNWTMTVSALSMQRALNSLTQELRTTAREDVPYPSQVMAEKLDPVILEDWNAECQVIATYLGELLAKAGYTQPDINAIQSNLVFTSYPHDYVIHRDRAIKFHLKVAEGKSEYLQYQELMQEWLVSYMLQPEFRHYIRFVTPKMGKENSDAADTGASGTVERPDVSSGRVGEEKEPATSRTDGARPGEANRDS